MKVFRARELGEAVRHAVAGGQALHLHRFLRRRAPKCFVRDVRAGKDIAHLFDQDLGRLYLTAKRFGLRKVLIERPGSDRQHIDLCGQPLKRALAEIQNQEKETQQCNSE